MAVDRRTIQTIKANLAAKGTDELLAIVRSQDTELWSVEAFEAARELIAERAACDEPTPTIAAVSPPNPTSASQVDSAPPSRGHTPVVLVAVLVLYGLACANPAIRMEGSGSWFGSRDIWGYEALAFGWLGNPFIWSANIFLVAGIIASIRHRERGAFKFGSIASAAALIAFVGGVHGLRIGFFLWLASMLTFTAGMFWLSRLDPRHPTKKKGSQIPSLD